jgi:hypothetical protein
MTASKFLSTGKGKSKPAGSFVQKMTFNLTLTPTLSHEWERENGVASLAKGRRRTATAFTREGE